MTGRTFREKLLRYLAVGATATAFMSVAGAAAYLLTKPQRHEKAMAEQTPALMQASAEKFFSSEGFGAAEFRGLSRDPVRPVTRLQYDVRKNGVDYVAEAICTTGECRAGAIRPVRSEKLEKQVVEMWKQNGYEVSAYSNVKMDGADATLTALVSKDGKFFNGETVCKDGQCGVQKISPLTLN